MKETYKGWSIHAFQQITHQSYKDFVAICRRRTKDHLTIHNVEGRSLKQAMLIAKEKIDCGEITVLPRNPSLIKPEFQ